MTPPRAAPKVITTTSLLCRGTYKHHTGIGLVEVLVALIVMSVGMLGIASLYVTTLQSKTTALSRMKAVNLANDIAERIRANPSAASAYLLATTDATVATDCTTANCTPEQMAASDLYQWDLMIHDTYNNDYSNSTNGTGLPGGTNAVQRSIVLTTPQSITTPAALTINLAWSEPSSGTLSYALQVQL